MSGYTPAPWRVPAHAWWQVVQESALPGDTCLAVVLDDPHRRRSLAEAKANARLMAAAPDLFVAVQHLCDAVVSDNEELIADAFVLAGEALKRAEGSKG